MSKEKKDAPSNPQKKEGQGSKIFLGAVAFLSTSALALSLAYNGIISSANEDLKNRTARLHDQNIGTETDMTTLREENFKSRQSLEQLCASLKGTFDKSAETSAPDSAVAPSSVPQSVSVTSSVVAPAPQSPEAIVTVENVQVDKETTKLRESYEAVCKPVRNEPVVIPASEPPVSIVQPETDPVPTSTDPAPETARVFKPVLVPEPPKFK